MSTGCGSVNSGYRSVFTTQLLTKFVVFLVCGRGRRPSCSRVWRWRIATRPVFVPTTGPNDPVARYRTTVIARLKLVRYRRARWRRSVAGLVAQTYWVRIQLFLHGGDFGVAIPQFGMDLGFYAFDLPFYQMVIGYRFVATFLARIANLFGHYLFGGVRLPGDRRAEAGLRASSRSAWSEPCLLLEAIAYWFDRYALLSNTRSGEPFTCAGYRKAGEGLTAAGVGQQRVAIEPVRDRLEQHQGSDQADQLDARRPGSARRSCRTSRTPPNR